MLIYKIAPKCLLPGPFGHSDVGGNPGVAGRFVAIISFLHTPVRDQAGVSWYALRFWTELGFKPALGLDRGALKSLGWQWQKTRRTDPERISRHWLVLPVATLLTLAYRTRVENAYDRRLAPGSLRAPPKHLAPTHHSSPEKPGRTVSVIRHGIDRLRRSLHRVRLWSRVWLLPEPWSEPKSNLEVTRLVPP